MDALPAQQPGRSVRSQQPPCHKTPQPHTTIDLYLKPVAKARQGQNDLRHYFRPVARANEARITASSRSNPQIEISPIQEVTNHADRTSEAQLPIRTLTIKGPSQSIIGTTDRQRADRRAPTKVPKHKHTSSAVLPKFDSYFDQENFPHSISPMAPRISDIMRHSLVPKPLNIRLPPLPAQASPTLSDVTSSPSSAGDPDTIFLDEERRDAPSFKQTYRSVHSRSDTNDSPISPLIALREPVSMSLNQRSNRPAALKSEAVPQLSGLKSTDSVIYFLPKFSPASDSSADGCEPLIRTKYPEQMKEELNRGSKKRANGCSSFNPAQNDKREAATEQKASTVSPGKHIFSLIKRLFANVHRSSTIL